MLNTPYGLAIDGNGYLFVAEATNSRVSKFVASTGEFVAWAGKIGTNIGMNIGGTCTSNAVGTFTGGWCTGGTSASGYSDGMFSSPYGLTIDTAGYLYVVENGRVSRLDVSTGAFAGWVGTIKTNENMTLGGTCASITIGSFTGGWCTGGTAKAGGNDGMLSYLAAGLAFYDGYLYVTDSVRISKYNASTGAFIGWAGRISAAPSTNCPNASVGSFTRGFCVGGQATAGPFEGMLRNISGLAVDSTGIYIGDTGNQRIQRFSPP
jgi:hypothetical protein